MRRTRGGEQHRTSRPRESPCRRHFALGRACRSRRPHRMWFTARGPSVRWRFCAGWGALGRYLSLSCLYS